MQCNQPFCGIGYCGPNCGQFYSYSPSPYYGTYPDVIGEGEVTSVLFPDGTIQFYFLPTTNKRWPYVSHNPAPNPSYRTNTGVWFIKNFSNPIPPAIFQQYCQAANGEPFSKSYNSDWNINSTPAFQLKFHNDNWTSTTDLHYFYPCLRQSNWFPTIRNIGSAAVQVDIPIDTRPICEHVCPCPCSYNNDNKNKDRSLKKVSNSSHMSIVQSKSKDSISRKNKRAIPLRQKKSSCCCLLNDKNKAHKKKNEVTCECDKSGTIDKSVTTYSDQASGCISAMGCETQTKNCGLTTAVEKVNSACNTTYRNTKTEIWSPKTPLSRKAMETKYSEKILRIHESTSSSCCICNSDTDG
ncbi:uncharacterized protein ACR2FA_000441 [Aphomia sociella]